MPHYTHRVRGVRPQRWRLLAEPWRTLDALARTEALFEALLKRGRDVHLAEIERWAQLGDVAVATGGPLGLEAFQALCTDLEAAVRQAENKIFARNATYIVVGAVLAFVCSQRMVAVYVDVAGLLGRLLALGLLILTAVGVFVALEAGFESWRIWEQRHS